MIVAHKTDVVTVFIFVITYCQIFYCAVVAFQKIVFKRTPVEQYGLAVAVKSTAERKTLGFRLRQAFGYFVSQGIYACGYAYVLIQFIVSVRRVFPAFVQALYKNIQINRVVQYVRIVGRTPAAHDVARRFVLVDISGIQFCVFQNTVNCLVPARKRPLLVNPADDYGVRVIGKTNLRTCLRPNHVAVRLP